jgi:acetyl esterase/lipase
VLTARLLLDFLKRGETHRYGPDRSQVAELHLPAGEGPHPVVVLIHGGSWSRRYGRTVMRALAGDLERSGWAVWNIEYRRLGNGGGWPETFADVAGAIDRLAAVNAPVDLDRVSLVGHSAGGHLALWAAGRAALPPGAPGALSGEAPVRFQRVIAQAGVCDLAGGYEMWHGGAVRALMGGSPAELPDRYAVADPLANVPVPSPVLLVHGVLDEVVSIELSRNYAHAARAAGANIELSEIQGAPGR